jgi:hypothetical protein
MTSEKRFAHRFASATCAVPRPNLEQLKALSTPRSNREGYVLHRFSFAVALFLITVAALIHAQSPSAQQPDYTFMASPSHTTSLLEVPILWGPVILGN